MGCNSGGVSSATSTCGGLYVWIMLFGRVLARESPRALDAGVGERGEEGAWAASFACKLCGVMVSTLSGGLPFSLVGVGEAVRLCFSEFGDAVPPPHWLMKDKTVSGQRACKGKAEQSPKVMPLSGCDGSFAVPLFLGIMNSSTDLWGVPRGKSSCPPRKPVHRRWCCTVFRLLAV